MGNGVKEDQDQDIYVRNKLKQANAMLTLKRQRQIIRRLQICRQTKLR
jgi:hypothetical protein